MTPKHAMYPCLQKRFNLSRIGAVDPNSRPIPIMTCQEIYQTRHSLRKKANLDEDKQGSIFITNSPHSFWQISGHGTISWRRSITFEISLRAGITLIVSSNKLVLEFVLETLSILLFCLSRRSETFGVRWRHVVGVLLVRKSLIKGAPSQVMSDSKRSERISVIGKPSCYENFASRPSDFIKVLAEE